MTTQYYVDEVETESDDESDEDPTWDALDWCYMVKSAGDDIICICATRDEAEHIMRLLIENPYKQ